MNTAEWIIVVILAAYPQYAVERSPSMPAPAARFLKNIGIIVDMSIVNAELPTSYSTHDFSCFVIFILISPQN